MRPKGVQNLKSSSSSSSTTSAKKQATDTFSLQQATLTALRGITLIVHVHNCSFPISCGEGKQTVKWLAITAARRYGAEAPSGRVRHRETYHSGRRPRPDTQGRPSSPEFTPTDNDFARNLPRYPQFGVTDETTGQILRRVDGVGGTYRRGSLSPIRVASPKRRRRRSSGGGEDSPGEEESGGGGGGGRVGGGGGGGGGFEEGEFGEANGTNSSFSEGEEEFWDAIQLTYDYARMEHPNDRHERRVRERMKVNQKRDDLRRQQLLGNFDVSSEPSWRNAAAAAAATEPRPNTVYKLRELQRGGRRRSSVVQNLIDKMPKKSMFADLTSKEKLLLRPTTTISVKRPNYGGQSPATPLRNWTGPRLSVPDSFINPADLFEEEGEDGESSSTMLHPNDVIVDRFVDGDHVWIDLDLQGGNAAESKFVELAFHRKKISMKPKKMKKKVKKVDIEQEVAKVARRLLVSRRSLSDDAATAKDKKNMIRLLEENIEKSKIHRVVKDDVELIQCQKFIFQNYLVLENTFRHFSFLAPGDNFSLSSNEWTALCNTTNVMKTEPTMNAAACGRVFIASNVNLSAINSKPSSKPEPFDEDNPKNALIMYEFIEALVRLSLEKYASKPNL